MTGDPEAWARRIDPEIRSMLDLVPRLDLTDIATARRERAELAARAAAGHMSPPFVRTEQRRIPGWPDGEPDVEVRVHERVRQVGPGKDGAKGSFTVYRVAGAG